MSEIYSYSIGKALRKVLKSPARSQFDLIKLLLETVREILTPNSDTYEINKEYQLETEILKIVFPNKSKERLQRIFYDIKYPDFKGKPMYTIQSISFPFQLMFEHNELDKIFYKTSSFQIELNSYIISKIFTIINILDTEELTWGKDWVQEIMEILYPSENDEVLNDGELFYLINDLMMLDFGYIRFDCDPKYENENHPLNHFDVNLDRRLTYKIGMKNPINIEEFIDIIDNNKIVRYWMDIT